MIKAGLAARGRQMEAAGRNRQGRAGGRKEPICHVNGRKAEPAPRPGPHEVDRPHTLAECRNRTRRGGREKPICHTDRQIPDPAGAMLC